MEGWIKLHRKLRENPIYRNSTAVHCWIECLLRASHTEKFVYAKKNKLKINQGMFMMGREEFGNAIGVSGSTAWHWINLFHVDNMIDIKTSSKGTVVTIKNWKEYQLVDSDVDNKKTAKKQQKNTNKNVKNDKNILLKSNTVRKTPDERVDYVINQFQSFAGHGPLDKQPRNVAYTWIRQTDRLIKDLSPIKVLEFNSIIKTSFDWYRKQNPEVSTKYLGTIRKHVTEILYEHTRKKYIPDYKLNKAS